MLDKTAGAVEISVAQAPCNRKLNPRKACPPVSKTLRPGIGQLRSPCVMSKAPAPIATPCVKVCAVDGESGLCLGCFRTLPEIAGWAKLADGRRTEIMAELPGRRGRIDPAKLGLA